MDAVPAQFLKRPLRTRVEAIASSFARLLGRPLVSPTEDVVSALWSAPRVIVAHGTGPDPVFFFGNRAALARFDMSLEAFTALPSRLSAEPLERDARQRLLNEVAQNGFIDTYSGIRISATGRRFRIENAIVWTLTTTSGEPLGQAAAFDRWTDLPE